MLFLYQQELVTRHQTSGDLKENFYPIQPHTPHSILMRELVFVNTTSIAIVSATQHYFVSLETKVIVHVPSRKGGCQFQSTCCARINTS